MEQLPSTSVKEPSTVIAEDVPDALEVNTVLSVEEVDKNITHAFKHVRSQNPIKRLFWRLPIRRNSFRSADLAGRSCSRRTTHFY